MTNGIRRAAATTFLTLVVTISNVWSTDAYAQRTYYLSPSGSDALGDGSQSNPWASVDRINALDLASGDQVLLQGGAVFTGSLYFDQHDAGTTARPIVVGSYGDGAATLYAGDGAAMLFYNAGGVRVENLAVRGADASSDARTEHGIVFYADDGRHQTLRIHDVEVSGFAGNGLLLSGYDAAAGFDDVRITNSAFFANGDGMRVYGPDGVIGTVRDLYVGDSRFYDNDGQSDATGMTGFGLHISNVRGGVVENVEAFENGPDGGAAAGIGVVNSSDVTVQYSYAHTNAGAGLAVHASAAADPVTVRFNVSDANAGGAVRLVKSGTAVAPVEVFHNTLVTDAADAVVVEGGEAGMRLLSNLIVAEGDARLLQVKNAAAGKAPVVIGNGYWRGGKAFSARWNGANYSDLEAWRRATGQETSGGVARALFADPGVTTPRSGSFGTFGSVPAYQITSTSAAAAKGLDLRAQFGLDPGAQDFFGSDLAGRSVFSLGAHQPAVVAALATQQIVLEAGWNLIASSVAPSDARMEAVFASVADDIRVVRDSSGSAYSPSEGVDEIGSWNVGEAYLVYAKRPVTLTVEGAPVPEGGLPLQLRNGWNVIPYTGQTAMDVETALASIDSQVVLIKDHLGAVYHPSFDINTIGQLRPGRGYRVFVSAPTQLVFPPDHAAN